MRTRQRMVIDRKTGDAVLASETIDDDADFAQRARELKASLPALADARPLCCAAVCDGCGTSADVDYSDPQLPPGWVSCDRGDLCPGCSPLN